MEASAALLLAAAIAAIAVWSRMPTDDSALPDPACLRPVELAGPGDNGAIWCNRDPDELKAVLARLSLEDCAQVVTSKAAATTEVLHLKLRVDCTVEDQRNWLTGKAALLTGTPIDVNQAHQADLEQIPGIGPVLAGAIVEMRDKEGPFCSVKALRRVRGIGSRKVAELARYIKAHCPDRPTL